MIMINGNWEHVNVLSDIIRIVKENIGDEFAQKVEEVFEDYSGTLISEIYELENIQDDLEEKFEYIDDFIKQLEKNIDVIKRKCNIKS